MTRARVRYLAVAALLLLAGGCLRRGGCSGEYCGTLVFVTGGEPDVLLPPLLQTTSARDVVEQMFLKLADIGMSTNTVGDEDFQPLIAQRWEWDNPLTLVFHLDPRARWQDGVPLRAADVAFTFDAYRDPKLNSPYAADIARIASVTVRDSLTVVYRFTQHYSEMFYDAVYHMRVLPAHLLAGIPRDQWVRSPFARAPVGDGPYKFASWKPAESLELDADSNFFLGRPHIRRLIWRFTPNLGVAVSQLVADQADALEFLGPPDNIKKAAAAPQLALYPYAGSNYGYLGFNLAANGDTTHAHPILGDRDVRRALAMAVDRKKLLQNVFDTLARVPPGPLAQMSWIWDDDIKTPPYDTAQAARLLAARGWIDTNRDGIRDKGKRKLSLDLLVPTTSGVRKQYARLLQAQYQAIGVELVIDEVEPAVFQQRGQAGAYDAMLAGWNADPSPSSAMAQRWSKRGFGKSNWSRYTDTAFDARVAQANAASDRASAKALWRQAMEVLSDDAPGVWLFAPDNVAAVNRRFADVRIRPDSWWALVWTWRIPPDKLIERDRVEH